MWNGSSPTCQSSGLAVRIEAPRTVVKQVLGPTGEKIEKFRVKVKKYFAVGDHVIALGSFRGRGKDTGADLDAATAHVWTLRDGKAVRVEAFHDPASWRKVLGLAQPEHQGMAA